jgi:hypothetical protein
VQSHGRVDGVANCVGSIVLKSAHTTTDAEFEQVGQGCLGRGALGQRGAGGVCGGEGSIVLKSAHATTDAEFEQVGRRGCSEG